MSNWPLYAIIGKDGKPLTDVMGRVIVMPTREEAARWIMPGEVLEPYDPAKHLPGEPRDR